MAQEFHLTYSDIVNRFSLLKSKIPNRKYQLYRSSAKNLGNIIEIQREARNIMDFVGLGHLVPVVTFCKENDKTAGHIELSDYDEENCVFIYIDESKRMHDNEILAVLAHEICHKVLKVNGIYFPLQDMENEIYTDLATIYMGLGLLTLNGCYSEHVSATSRTISTSGYLTYPSYAIAFVLVNGMEGSPSMNYDSALSSHAYEAVKGVEWLVKPLTADSLRNNVQSEREYIATRARYISEMEHYLYVQKCKLPQDFSRCNYLESNIKGNSIENPYQVIQSLSGQTGQSGQTGMFKKMLLAMAELDMNAFSDPCKVLCPKCLKKFQTQSSANCLIMVECPHCNTRFVWDNSKISLLPEPNPEAAKKKSFFERFLNFFRPGRRPLKATAIELPEK